MDTNDQDTTEYVCSAETFNFMSNDWILIHNPNNQHECEIWKRYQFNQLHITQQTISLEV